MLFFNFKIAFTCATNRAFPVIGYILKRGSGDDAVVWVAFRGIVDIAANGAYVFFH